MSRRKTHLQFFHDKRRQLEKHGWQHKNGDVGTFYTNDELKTLTLLDSHILDGYHVATFTKEDYVFSMLYYSPIIIHFRYKDRFFMDKIEEVDINPEEKYLTFLRNCNNYVVRSKRKK